MIKNSHYSQKTMRIAYVFNQPSFLGGGEISLAELIRSNDKERIEPIVIVPARGEIEEKYRNENIKVIAISFPMLKYSFTGTSFLAVYRLIQVIKKNRIDIIHTNGSRASFYSGIAGRLLRIPMVWHVRETIKDIYFYDALLAMLSTVILCVSQNVKTKRFKRFGNHIFNKIHVVYNGIDTVRFQRSSFIRKSIRRELGIGENEILFGIVGNIYPLKGQDHFLRGFARAREKASNLSAKAIIIGKILDPPFRNELSQLAMDLNLNHHVIFHEYSDKINEILCAMDVFVLFSDREGFSRSILEAMSTELPVLASNLGEIEEAITDGKNGFLFERHDTEGIASAIITLSRDKTMRSTMGEVNRRRAKDYFSLENHRLTIEHIYRELSSETV